MARPNAEVGSAANSYEILAKIAMGGMAEIFLARGASAGGVERYVVLKRVLRQSVNDPSLARMFLDEARLAAQLQHPNIAQVYDIGKLGDSYFFTMEYVHGETVRNLLQRSHALRQQIPISAVLTVIAGAAAGLHHAHERKGMDGRPLGIVHRDVSPSNLMVSYEGTVKVVDFGVAKAAHRDTETRSGTVKGKITYMSPEQCRDLDIDRRSDLFSLGIVMWEMLTLDRLYRRNSDFENMQAIVSESVARPSSIRPDVPPAVDEIVRRLLAKEPAQRYQSAEELHEAIEAAAVAAGSALSAASLGRFMRDLFGQRPEPWVELQSQLSHPEHHTITNEPLGGPTYMTGAAELDMQLSAVPLLSQHMTAQQPAAAAPRPMHTIPLRVQIQDLDVVTPPAPRPSQPSGEVVYAPPAPSAAQALLHYPRLESSPSMSAAASYSNASYEAAHRRRSIALAVIAPITVIAVGVGLALAVRGKGKKPAAESANVVAMPSGPMEPVVAAPPAPPPAAAASPEVAAPPQPAPPAETAVAAPSADAERDKAPPADKKAAARPPRDDLTSLYKAGRFADVVAACSAAGKTAAQNATTCTVAACKTRDTAKAKHWMSSVAAGKRPAVVKECGGILPPEPASRKAEDLCKREPLACQH